MLGQKKWGSLTFLTGACLRPTALGQSGRAGKPDCDALMGRRKTSMSACYIVLGLVES